MSLATLRRQLISVYCIHDLVLLEEEGKKMKPFYTWLSVSITYLVPKSHKLSNIGMEECLIIQHPLRPPCPGVHILKSIISILIKYCQILLHLTCLTFIPLQVYVSLCSGLTHEHNYDLFPTCGHSYTEQLWCHHDLDERESAAAQSQQITGIYSQEHTMKDWKTLWYCVAFFYFPCVLWQLY